MLGGTINADLTVIGDLDGLPIGDTTQDVTALIAHLAMRDGPHVARRSTLLGAPVVPSFLLDYVVAVAARAPSGASQWCCSALTRAIRS